MWPSQFRRLSLSDITISSAFSLASSAVVLPAILDRITGTVGSVYSYWNIFFYMQVSNAIVDSLVLLFSQHKTEQHQVHAVF